MNDIRIRYASGAMVRYFVVGTAVFYGIIGFYVSIKEALASQYGMQFYCGLVMIVLAIILILSFTIWHSKPILVIDSTTISANFADQKHVPVIMWDEVKELGIGISNIKVSAEKKVYDIDLSTLKYVDLKNVKARLVELCESKNIPYHNI
ncbi:hypothetical protein [Dysgonomonas sp. 520]|uniref:hypothetical protein n=1 Tax=Dysgonomonas sp. 520 TaxID=2302931 RepID=UPI0013D629F3|nr:hypothetical protein [Dysgonomonas sp. 520]NDW09581.1 hypothetical protein [Dysgonomonas sp. 520]